jgi:hypothetical protein
MIFACPQTVPPMDAFTAEYTPILGAYYYITMYRNKLLHQQVEVFAAVSEVLTGRRKIPLYRRFVRFFSLRSRVETVLDLLLQNQQVNFGLRRYVADKKRDNTITEDNAFARFVKELLEEEFTIPVDEVRDVIRVVEERRLRYFQNSTTLIAGLAGGILGALLTYLISSGGRGH